MKLFVLAFSMTLALAACAALTPVPEDHSGHGTAASGTSQRGGMMDEMCQKHATGAASAPGMMAKHCKDRADKAVAAASAAR